MRTFFIGDIHGCIDELRELLDLLSPSADDQVVSLGDIVAKGPASEECVRLWMERGYAAVRGNQDEKWVSSRWRRGPVEKWLASRPLYLDMPERGVIAVHGGILPGSIADLDRQRATLPTLRFVRKAANGRWIAVKKDSEREGDIFWADLWDGERTVVYGHAPTPERAPSIRPKAIGVDTGCVYGGRLTAAILEKGAWGFVSVDAKRNYASRD